MTPSMQLFVFIWLAMTSRVWATVLAGRQCFRYRQTTPHRVIYQWMTAFGLGMWGYALTDAVIILNGVFNSPVDRAAYPTGPLWVSMLSQFGQSGAMWLITLVLLNGGAPGFVRAAIFWVLAKVPNAYEPPTGPQSEHHDTQA
jgi:hypothetical protein